MSAAFATQSIADDRPHLATSAPVAVLARYRDETTPREVVLQRAAHGTMLVIDRRDGPADDQRLIAHLAADEPPQNADLVCADYLHRLRTAGACRPRAVAAADLTAVPFAPGQTECARGNLERAPLAATPLVDADGCSHRIERVTAPGLGIPEWRWMRRPPVPRPGAARVVSVREVIGYVEDYEPARSLTAITVTAHRSDPATSVATLRAELERVAVSRIVLNRRLRERLLHTVAHEQVSMSEIAIRCGRVKRDTRGNVSGETSWLARRLGLAPEGGELRPTPWIHSDVLALIARSGLGLSPREVELA